MIRLVPFFKLKTKYIHDFHQNIGECFVGDRIHWTNFLKPYNDDKLKSNIKLSSVNINYDANVWDWDLVTAIFKSPVSDAFKALEIPDYKNFVKRVLDYFKVCVSI